MNAQVTPIPHTGVSASSGSSWSDSCHSRSSSWPKIWAARRIVKTWEMAAIATRRFECFQFHGSNSASRLCGISAMRPSTLASQASGCSAAFCESPPHLGPQPRAPVSATCAFNEARLRCAHGGSSVRDRALGSACLPRSCRVVLGFVWRFPDAPFRSGACRACTSLRNPPKLGRHFRAGFRPLMRRQSG